MRTAAITFFLALMSTFVLKSQTVDFTYDLNGNRTGRSLTVMRASAKDFAFFDDESDAKGEATADLPTDEDILPDDLSGAIRIYPNPFSSTIVVDTEGYPNSFVVGVEVFSIDGRLMYRDDNHARGGSVDLSRLQEGIYVLRVTIGPERSVFRIVKTY